MGPLRTRATLSAIRPSRDRSAPRVDREEGKAAMGHRQVRLDRPSPLPRGISSDVSGLGPKRVSALSQNLREESACRRVVCTAPGALAANRLAGGQPGCRPPGCDGPAGMRLSCVHGFRLRSWTFCAWVSFRRHPGKVRAWVRPRCFCNSKSPNSRFLKVVMTKAPLRPLILEASSPRLTSRR